MTDRTIWLLLWGTSVDGRGDPQPIGYTDDPSVVAEFNRRCEQNPYAFWQTIEAKPIQMEDLPR